MRAEGAVGREIKRVPVGFDADEWYGVHGEPPEVPCCRECHGSARNEKARFLYGLLGYRGYAFFLRAFGVAPTDWGRCPRCHGSGEEPGHEAEQRARAEWTPSEPPRGEAYLLWSSTVEAPMSPAMETPEALAEWLVQSKTSTFAGRKATYEEWLEFIEGAGAAFSHVTYQGRVLSGVEAVSRKAPWKAPSDTEADQE